MRFTHINIVANDWKKVAEFYKSVFGCVEKPPLRKLSGKWLEQGTGIPQASLEGIHLYLPGFGDKGPTLEIFTFKEVKKTDPGQANHRGLTHLAFEVDDIEAMVIKLKNNGGSLLGIITETFIEGVGPIVFVYARDPEGNIIELQKWK